MQQLEVRLLNAIKTLEENIQGPFIKPIFKKDLNDIDELKQPTTQGQYQVLNPYLKQNVENLLIRAGIIEKPQDEEQL